MIHFDNLSKRYPGGDEATVMGREEFSGYLVAAMFDHLARREKENKEA